ncbi:carbohydrate ABC transporter permease [Paenibacillus thalictri]|uniref:Carbohydrate ABC transporter permease n=1 Tax=Paenibacillus thalictri TaxID=2527873 RepID=A0A4Q9DIN2_9BACL|nr:carbohydrate ABC transporter permease [Paenibacillus thalictri]TBL70540.1 carbohydrate ABC transporter permease [Paenibacillus thalictri]
MPSSSLIRSREDRIVDNIVLILGAFILLAVAYPLIYVVSASLSEPKLITLGEVYLLPKGFTLDGYRKIFEYDPIWTGYRNTLFYTIVGTSLNVALTLTCAYALSRRDLIGRNLFTFLFTFTLFFSGGLLPTYLVVKKLQLVNTVWALLLPNAVSMWNVIIARTYFQSTIPNELKEAAFIDGCSNFKLFVRIVLPLSKPIIAVLILFYAVGHWNSFFSALIYLSDLKLYPLQLILRNVLIMDQMVDLMGLDAEAMQELVKRMELKEAMKFGIIVVSSLPVLVLYPFLQKYFVKGVMIGAIKG